MQLLTISCALIGIFAARTSATIAIGESGGLVNTAWIYGEDPCDGVANINPEGQNPCGIKFTLRNGYTYSLGNCGDPIFSLYNADGSFNAQCAYEPADIGCGVKQTWRC